MQGKTVIAIAQMDRIIVPDQGRVVEDGPHEALLAKKRHLCRSVALSVGRISGVGYIIPRSARVNHLTPPRIAPKPRKRNSGHCYDSLMTVPYCIIEPPTANDCSGRR